MYLSGDTAFASATSGGSGGAYEDTTSSTSSTSSTSDSAYQRVQDAYDSGPTGSLDLTVGVNSDGTATESLTTDGTPGGAYTSDQPKSAGETTSDPSSTTVATVDTGKSDLVSKVEQTIENATGGLAFGPSNEVNDVTNTSKSMNTTTTVNEAAAQDGNNGDGSPGFVGKLVGAATSPLGLLGIAATAYIIGVELGWF